MIVFFFKHEPAYVVGISDWSSDVCSSKLDGGFVRADMTVTLASVTTDEGVPTSTVDLEIPEATMEAMDAATEAGDDAKIWWDLHITPSGGVKFVALEGPFTVKAG